MMPNSEFCHDFIDKMKNRMAVSYAKYGAIKDAFPKKIDAIESLIIRLDKYRDTGNTEYLVDIANFAMIEFMLPAHPKSHFKAMDANESPGRFSRTEDITTKSNSELSDEAWNQ